MTLSPRNRRFKCFLCNFRLLCALQGKIATKWLEMDQDNRRTRTAKAVARLVSFAHITCFMIEQARVIAYSMCHLASTASFFKKYRRGRQPPIFDIMALGFVLKADILSTCCNKDDVTWHVWHFQIQQLPVVFVAICFWADACGAYFPGMNSLLQAPKRPHYSLGLRPLHISQSSAATVLKWGGQNYSHLRQVSSRCCLPK